MKPVRSMALLAVTLLLVGCNTPGSRIKQKQALFDTFPPEVQENLRNGRVDIGYTREMVDIALGNPNRIYTRKTAAVNVTVLAYTAYETQRDRQRIQADLRVRDSSGSYRTVRDWVWVDVEHRNEYDRLRVEMTGDVVTAVETASR
jgi:hypothetical protein